jgi:hypothetical protein
MTPTDLLLIKNDVSGLQENLDKLWIDDRDWLRAATVDLLGLLLLLLWELTYENIQEDWLV